MSIFVTTTNSASSNNTLISYLYLLTRLCTEIITFALDENNVYLVLLLFHYYGITQSSNHRSSTWSIQSSTSISLVWKWSATIHLQTRQKPYTFVRPSKQGKNLNHQIERQENWQLNQDNSNWTERANPMFFVELHHLDASVDHLWLVARFEGVCGFFAEVLD